MQTESSAAITTRRLNLVLSDTAHAELSRLSHESRRSMTEIVRLSLGLVKMALEETKLGNRIVVTTAEGRVLKEIILPD